MCSVFIEHASERADMLVPGAVNGCPVDAVIDTGSAATLLSEDFADRLPKELEKETSDQGPKLDWPQRATTRSRGIRNCSVGTRRCNLLAPGKNC